MTSRTVATAPRRSGAQPVTAEFVQVTPEIATKWLGHNLKNRSRRPRATDRYIRDMRNGDWALTGDPVRFAADGQLLDGQHRLTAVVESGVSVVMLVVRGLDTAAQDVMDTGVKRTAADALSLHGRAQAAKVAATARLVVSYKAGLLRDANGNNLMECSHSEIIQAIAEDPSIEWAVGVASGAARNLPANPTAVAFAAWLGGRTDRDDVTEFLVDVAELRTSGSGDPRHALLRRLQIAKENKDSLSSTQQAYLIWRAWIAQFDGEDLKLLKLSTSNGASQFPPYLAAA